MVSLNPRTAVLVAVCLDMIGVGLIIPCMSSLSISLGATPAQYGFISSLYGIGQLIGSPVCGSLSDKLGRKSVLLLSIGGAGLFYLLMGSAWSLYVILISRVGVGLIKQTQTIGSVYIAEVVPIDQRTRAMALFSTVMGLGFIIGPICGSLLARKSLRLPFFLSAGLFFVDLVFGWTFLPTVTMANPHLPAEPCPVTGQTEGDCPGQKAAQGTKPTGTGAQATQAGQNGGLELCPAMKGQSPLSVRTWLQSTKDVAATLRVMRKEKKIFSLLLFRVLSNAALLCLETSMLIFLEKKFAVDSKSNGFVLAYFGVLGVVYNFLLVERFKNWCGGEQASVAPSFVISGVGCLCLAFAPTFNFFLLGVTVFSFGVYSSKACLLALFTTASPVAQRGAYLGVSGSLDSLVRVLMPVTAGFLLQQDLSLPYCLSGLGLLVLAANWSLRAKAQVTQDAIAGEGDKKQK